MIRRGFTIVELIITITIMSILLTLAVVNVNTTQMNARDDERKTDVQTIGSYLDSFYSSGFTSGTSAPPTITNFATNPSFETDTSSVNLYNGATLTRTASVTASSGGYVGSIDKTTAGSGLIALIYPIPYQPNTDISVRLRIRLSPGSGPTNTVNVMIPGYYGGSGVGWSTKDGDSTAINSGTLSSSAWTDIVLQGYKTVDNSTLNRIGVGIIANEAWAANNGVEVDSIMIVQSSTIGPYADGDSSGWQWAGTPDISASTGPIIAPSTPGVYPPTSLATPALLRLYFPDADIKAFTTPGKSDPYTTFIPATNTIQTAAGVLPQPTIDQYVYQPIDTNGDICTNTDCRKYNIYYRLEADNAVYRATSKNQ